MKKYFLNKRNTKLMLYDKDHLKGIISQRSCNYTKEGRKGNCSNKLASSKYIKQLKQQQHVQVHRNKYYEKRQLYKCEAEVIILSRDFTSYLLLQLE